VKRVPESPEELRARALRLLARREHSRVELEGKLAPDAESSETLARVLDALEMKKQISDERFAEERARQLARRYGAERVGRELIARGVAEGTAARLSRIYGAEDVARAGMILKRRYPKPATTARERAWRLRFLQARGFSMETIRSLMRATYDLQAHLPENEDPLA
jgi:regulatory protein